jgi:hypothetical protein
MIRRMKVYEMGDAFLGKVRPQIRLQGKWLQETGFSPHDKIVVKKEGNKLVIERA